MLHKSYFWIQTFEDNVMHHYSYGLLELKSIDSIWLFPPLKHSWLWQIQLNNLLKSIFNAGFLQNLLDDDSSSYKE